MIWYTATAAVLLALTHLFAERLKFSSIPRSKWLSFAGGVSVTYIFVHLLPELAEGQEMIQENGVEFLEHHTYLIALIGLALFYGLEKTAKQSSESAREAPGDEMAANLNVFWLHITSFALYNAIIGYLLVHREDESWRSLLWFTIAMAFHFVVNDYGLMDHYHNAYRRKGRWIIMLAILGGWLIGVLTDIPEIWIIMLFAFIGGGTIMNVLKEELPQERKSNFWAFGAGIFFYSLLLLFI
jgi:zinc transporter ZupT